MLDVVKAEGNVEIIIDHKDGRREFVRFKNKILRSGRIAMAAMLSNDTTINSSDIFLSQIAFGSGGTIGSSPKTISDSQNGLNGPTIATKSVITSIDSDNPTLLHIVSVLSYTEGNGIINEMGLQMHSGDFYSMSTFGNIEKTSSMQFTINWSINFV